MSYFCFHQELYGDINNHRASVSSLDQLTRQLAMLCTSGDQSFLHEVTNEVQVWDSPPSSAVHVVAHQVQERVQTLSKGTEEKKDLLENRLKSWEAFPVQEAREVKSFVQQLESQVSLDLDENCSAEELLEQLRHLEVGGAE